MTKLLTAAEMRALEAAAIESGRVTGLELMERAGRAVVAAVLEKWPALATAPHRALVLCGPGNNGGDGFVVARLLRERGWDVEVFLYGDPDRLPPDARTNHRRWADGGAVTTLGFRDLQHAGVRALARALATEPVLSEREGDAPAPALVVDAVFGTGLTRPADAVSPLFDLSAADRGNAPARWVAVDVPSGMCSDSGRLYRAADDLVAPHPVIAADLTVTFHRAKVGHLLDRAETWCGSLVVRDIGLEDAGEGVPLSAAPTLFLGKRQGHKYDHGHALVLGGGPGVGGAARLAARGALRVGAGAVTLGVPPAAVAENAAQLDAIMLRPVEDLADFLAGPGQKMNALCLGMGLGRGERTRATVGAACASGRTVVLDADALTSFENAPDTLFAHLHERCVLTPHLGEFGRVFPDLRARLAEPAERGPLYSKLDAARAAACRSGAVVLLKGADTVLAAPSGEAAVNAALYDRAAPWLATAGAGDVLAGMIAGLLARGFSPMTAAGTAAWLHVEAARRFGPGLIAEDLPEQIPGVFRDLGL